MPYAAEGTLAGKWRLMGWCRFGAIAIRCHHPGEVVNQALADAIARVHTGVVIRPWLQDLGYRDSQVRSSIEAAEEFDLDWMLRNAVSEVSVGALKTDDAPEK